MARLHGELRRRRLRRHDAAPGRGRLGRAVGAVPRAGGEAAVPLLILVPERLAVGRRVEHVPRHAVHLQPGGPSGGDARRRRSRCLHLLGRHAHAPGRDAGGRALAVASGLGRRHAPRAAVVHGRQRVLRVRDGADDRLWRFVAAKRAGPADERGGSRLGHRLHAAGRAPHLQRPDGGNEGRRRVRDADEQQARRRRGHRELPGPLRLPPGVLPRRPRGGVRRFEHGHLLSVSDAVDLAGDEAVRVRPGEPTSAESGLALAGHRAEAAGLAADLLQGSEHGVVVAQLVLGGQPVRGRRKRHARLSHAAVQPVRAHHHSDDAGRIPQLVHVGRCFGR
mmetsp:Transcript_100717/g.307887  ORF Transcript_100717/g.307887 Transcript_100717/m.307887 type:complete len:336 (+) Transcript_100717:391-1398(+)